MARHTRNKRTNKTVALVGDGQTERIYFANVRDTDRPSNLDIFPDYPRKIGSYKGVLERAVTLKNTGYDHVYALIDMDKIINENRMAEYHANKQSAEQSGVTILENNPCFETWILLHFSSTGKLFTSCDNVIAEIRKPGAIANYEKGERYLTGLKPYERYKKLLKENAIPNAKKLEVQRDGRSDRYPRAETFRFFEWYFEHYNV
ncbi:RloB family protein [Olivibacter sitiensis]|uniref:RloB family protein n=1 Tax=Olivibacter sitiensis TaxID=376470 RepID=UPI000425A54B|nr:RloB family protein [Olivibacter sitiensis]